MKAVKLLGEGAHLRRGSLQLKKMQGYPGVWEARADLSNRITLHYETDGTIVLRTNCNHDQVSRSP